MADLTPDADAARLQAADEPPRLGRLVQAALFGAPVFLTDSNGWDLASAQSADKRQAHGFTLMAGQAGDQVPILSGSGGRLFFGAAVTDAVTYVVSPNDGRIAPRSDLVSGQQVITLGVGQADGFLDVQIHNTGTVVP